MALAIDKNILRSLLGLASVVELRDPYTGGHSWRVGQFSKMLAAKVAMEGDDVFLASIGGFLHDLGKIGVPDAILKKPDRLTDQEYAVIRTHPVMGAELLADHPLADLAMEAVLHHHERPDGRGYPHGLEGDQAPMIARIVGLCDAFDAMTSTRSYRRGMPIDKALAILEDGKGRQFDIGLVDAFMALHRLDGRLEQVVGHSNHGQPLVDCPQCGPVIAVPRGTAEGSSVPCRTCGGMFRLNRDGDGWAAEPLGVAADADLLRPRPEVEVLDEFVAAAPAEKASFFLGRISTFIGLGGQ